MPDKKPKTPKRAASQNPSATTCIKLGQAQADEILAFRARQRKKRARALAAIPERALALEAPSIPTATLRTLGMPAATGILIAEGDSWFDYPLHDVLSLLEDEHGYDVESVARRGDGVEQMAYSKGQFADFARRLEKLLRQGRVPDAILLSGGGNDIAGEEFEVLLNHAASGLPPVNPDILRGVIDVRLRDAYVFLISGITKISEQFLNRAIPILIHGYDFPVPDGRGFLGGFGPLPGPWLRPGFHKKGHLDQGKNTQVMHNVINVFNDMLKGVSNLKEFGHVRFVDLRGTLANTNYKKNWANELHPTGPGFELVTKEFADALAKL